MNRKLVSVVIPAYNAKPFITDAINSVFNQLYRPCEIIVVNDGSTDGTEDTVNGLSSSTPSDIQLRIIDIGENKGAANALNIGFSSANGDYICWLSADDVFIDRMKTSNQIEEMNRTGALWSYFRGFYQGQTHSDAKPVNTNYLPHLSFLDPIFVRNADLRLMLLMFRNPINGSSIMIRKDCIEKYNQFDPVLKNVDADGDLWMRYSALGIKLIAINGLPLFYREHSQQTSQRTLSMLYGNELTRLRILSTLHKARKLKELCQKFTIFFFILFKAREHLNRPFTTEFLCNFIINNKNDFSWFLVKYAKRSLNDVEGRISSLNIDRHRFANDLQKIVQTPIFESFEQLLMEGEKA